MIKKAISIWQPWSGLIVSGHKTIETRSWPAPRALIGTRIAIASTKSLKNEALVEYAKPEFQRFYGPTGLPALDKLPRGAILGSVVLAECGEMTQKMIDTVHPRERAFGVWKLGHYAWLLIKPQQLDEPIPIRGAQGLWNYESEAA